ncbi:MAG: ral secretion pathway protein [Pyrinomonadaceae bacterium]|jgi:general secretion pathway protein D|nr:ral secretion pathway protein [Pyrinomonadaceae bacterium]
MRKNSEGRVLISLLVTVCLLLLPMTALAKKGDRNFKQGMTFEKNQQWEKAAQEFTLAVAADPSNLEYQLHFRRASFNASQAFMQQGRALSEQRDFVGAYNAFRQAYGYDPVNQLAVSEMDRMLQLQGVKEGTLNGNGLRPAEPGDVAQVATATDAPLPSTRTEQLRVISYSGDLKAFIRSLAEQLNLNVIFDRQSFVQPRQIDINLRDVSTSQALDYVFLQEGLFFQKLSRRTIVVADQTRRPQYQQLVLRTFYLANSDPEKVKGLVQQAIPPSVGRPQTIVVSDPATNSLTVRDTAENVRLIGELIQSVDKDRAEVVMDVNIYEVSNNDLLQLGNQIGSASGDSRITLGGSPGLSVLTANGARNAASTGVNLASIIGGAPTAAAAALLIPPSVFTAFQSKGNTRLIASTQVHAFNGEESSARIGQRVPVQTAQAYPFGIQTGTSTSNNGFPTGGFPVINYEPTGLTLKFTPQVFPNQDVQVKMSIESKDVLGASTLTPTFTERTITGTARVQNNRTMMLASVAQDVQSNGRAGLPLLGLIPVLGRLFTSPTRENRRIDIVIAVTPRVLRAPAVTPRDEEMRPSGTLQSPTTGSLEAMLREADHEEQIAAARQQQRNATARPSASFEPATTAQVANNSPTEVANITTITPLATTVTTNSAATNNTPNNVVATQPAPANNPQVAKSQAAQEELPAFVPAPKSLVSNSEATQVAAVNTNLNTNAGAVLTSMPRQIETAVTPVSANTKSAQLILAPSNAVMKVGETRRFALELTSDASLAMAILALRFNPKVIRIKGLSAGTALTADNGNKEGAPGMTQSIDATGMCLISLSNLRSALSLKDSGLWLFIDIEAVSSGDAGLFFDTNATHLMATDAGNVALDLSPIHAVVK